MPGTQLRRGPHLSVVDGVAVLIGNGEHHVPVTEVERYGRDDLRNGTGLAKLVYTQWRVDLGDAVPPALPADEVSVTGYARDDTTPVEGVYLAARKDNVVVFVVYAPKGDTVRPLLKGNPHPDHDRAYAYRLRARPDDVAVAARVAGDILSAITLE